MIGIIPPECLVRPAHNGVRPADSGIENVLYLRECRHFPSPPAMVSRHGQAGKVIVL
jgi:hypothetical protein